MSKLAERMIVRALLAATATMLIFASEMVSIKDERSIKVVCANMSRVECAAPAHPSEFERPPLPAPVK